MTTTKTTGTALIVFQSQAEPVPGEALIVANQSAVVAEFNAIMERERRRNELQQSVMPENRTALLAALKAAGIVRLEINYDGCGDSGQINEQNATLATDETIALEDVKGAGDVTLASVGYDLTVNRTTQDLAAAVETYCYDVLETYHSGYENNDGGNGDFAFDVEAGTIELVHNDVVTDYDTTTHEL